MRSFIVRIGPRLDRHAWGFSAVCRKLGWGAAWGARLVWQAATREPYRSLLSLAPAVLLAGLFVSRVMTQPAPVHRSDRITLIEPPPESPDSAPAGHVPAIAAPAVVEAYIVASEGDAERLRQKLQERDLHLYASHQALSWYVVAIGSAAEAAAVVQAIRDDANFTIPGVIVRVIDQREE